MLSGFDLFLYTLFQYAIEEWSKHFTKPLSESLIVFLKVWIFFLICKAIFKYHVVPYLRKHGLLDGIK